MSEDEKSALKKIVTWSVFIVFLVWLLARFTMVQPGHVGVVVNLFGDDKGASPHEKEVGMHWIAPWKRLYKFPIFEQNHTWQASKTEQYGFVSQTSEGMSFWADIGITFHLDPTKVPLLFAKYRRGVDEIVHDFVRNYIRDSVNMSASHMKIEELYGEGKEAFFHQVEEHVRKDLHPIGIEVSRIYLIGRFHFPDNVVQALNAKIEATQKAQQRENELRETKAQAEKEIAKAHGESTAQIIRAEANAKATIAQAEAEARSQILIAESKAKAKFMMSEAEALGNKLIAQSISKEIISYHEIKQWDGKLPTMMPSNVVPFLNMEKK